MIENRLTLMYFGIIILAKLKYGDPASREHLSLLKVVLMGTKRLFLIMLLLIIGCQQTGSGQDTPVVSLNMIEKPLESKPDEQLDINKNALLKDTETGQK
jgi:hypothetical protein